MVPKIVWIGAQQESARLDYLLKSGATDPLFSEGAANRYARLIAVLFAQLLALQATGGNPTANAEQRADLLEYARHTSHLAPMKIDDEDLSRWIFRLTDEANQKPNYSMADIDNYTVWILFTIASAATLRAKWKLRDIESLYNHIRGTVEHGIRPP